MAGDGAKALKALAVAASHGVSSDERVALCVPTKEKVMVSGGR